MTTLPRAVRQAMPQAREVLQEVAKLNGVCIRPVAMKRLDTTTGQWEYIDVPCGAVLEAKCSPCAKRNRHLRVAQCREGWHLDHEPITPPDKATEDQQWLIEFRADLQARLDTAPESEPTGKPPSRQSTKRSTTPGYAATSSGAPRPPGGPVPPSGDRTATGEYLPTWEEALDQLDEPYHVIRFGTQVDVKGVLAGTKDADQCIRYLSKYLTKSLGQSLDAQHNDHAARLTAALRFEPCAPTCPNWLRYGVQPKGAKEGMSPGRCRGKAHKPDHLGYSGRRVLVSRKWSNKTLTEHKQDRRTWVMQALGHPDEPIDPHRYVWRPVPSGDDNVPPLALRLLRSIKDRQRWRAQLDQLLSAAGEVA